MVSPPLYRHSPSWYQHGLSQIAAKFSTSLTADSPPNLHLLSSFNSQDLMPDGSFLTPVSGLHYVIHLFDQSEVVLLAAFSPTDARLSHVQEVGRQHDDRLTYLENRHGQLAKRFDLRIASESEFNDWVTNRSEEDWLTFNGLPRLPGTGRQWQNAARKQATDILRLVLKVNRAHSDFKVLYVVDPLRGRPGQTVMNVRLNSIEASRHLRDLYSSFFRHERPVQLPAVLKGVSLRNKVTLQTRIRITILQQLGALYKASNPGSSVDIRGYDPRPLLVTIIPASPGSASVRKTYNFIQAVTTLPANFSDDHLARIFQTVGTHHVGELRALFVVLSDDDRERCQNLARARLSARGGFSRGGGSGFSSGASGATQSVSTSGVVSGPGDGMDLQAGFLSSLRSQPPPPPPLESAQTDKSTRRKTAHFDEDESDGKRGLKRRHLSSSRSRSRSPRSRHHKKKKSKRSRRSPSTSSSTSSPPPRRSGQRSDQSGTPSSDSESHQGHRSEKSDKTKSKAHRK